MEGRFRGSKAIGFNQSESYAAVPKIDITGKNITIAAWIKVANLTGQTQTIYGDWVSPWHFCIGISKSGVFLFGRKGKSGSYTYLYGKAVTLNKWVHVAITWNKNEGIAHSYIDAELVGDLSFSPSDAFYGPSSDPCKIGNDGHPDDHQFHGSVMDLYVLNITLSRDEVDHLRGT